LHDISPIDSIQNSANGHPTPGILSNRVLRLYPYIGTGFVECNNYMYNTMEFRIGYRFTRSAGSLGWRSAKPKPPLGAGIPEWYHPVKELGK